MKSFPRLLVTLAATCLASPLLLSDARAAKPLPQKPIDRVIQIAPFERLAQGGYDGYRTAPELLRVANFGIGTFTGLDGEMILLDGVMFQAQSSGELRVAGPSDIVPYATLTRFRGEYQFKTGGPIADYPALQALLTSLIPEADQVVSVKVHGRFDALTIRAPRKQNKPYPVLTEALKTQAVFERSAVFGTLVGFRHPSYFGNVNVAGYHFHFVSDDKKMGGHVLALSTNQSLTIEADTIEEYDVEFGKPD